LAARGTGPVPYDPRVGRWRRRATAVLEKWSSSATVDTEPGLQVRFNAFSKLSTVQSQLPIVRALADSGCVLQSLVKLSLWQQWAAGRAGARRLFPKPSIDLLRQLFARSGDFRRGALFVVFLALPRLSLSRRVSGRNQIVFNQPHQL
jgi:hypothetical protein